MRLFFVIKLFFALLFSYEIKAQDHVQVSHSSAFLGEKITLEISSDQVKFSTTAPTKCPSKLYVDVSNIVFTQGSGTTNFRPSDVKTNQGKITATVTIPATAPTGYYKITFGAGEQCPLVSSQPFLVSSPYLNLSTNSGYLGQSLNLQIDGYGVTFSESSASLCPSLINVSPTKITFINNSGNSFHPSDITVNNNSIEALVNVPADIPKGYYNVIVGSGESCSLPSYGFYVSGPTISVFPATGIPGETIEVAVHGNGVTFDEIDPTVCPAKLHVSPSNIVFRQGSATTSGQITEFTPSSIRIENDILYAVVTIPNSTSPVFYNLIIGDQESCSVSHSFNVSSPTINVYPSSAYLGETIQVQIDASHINFDQDSPSICPGQLNVSASTIVFFRQGSGTISINPSFIQTYNGNINATITIPENASQGAYDLMIGSGEACSAFKSSAFNVMRKIPPSISVYPNSATKGQTLNVTITGNGVTFNQGSSTICSQNLNVTSSSDIVFTQGSGTAWFSASSLYSSNGNLVATVTIPEGASPGYYNVTVKGQQGCSISSYSSFYVNAPATPTFNLYPSYSTAGTELEVYIMESGVDFQKNLPSSCPGTVNVDTSNILFTNNNGFSFRPISVNDQNGYIVAGLSIPYEAPIGTYSVTVGTDTQCPVSVSNAFTISGPSISVSPSYATLGQTLELNIIGSGVIFQQQGQTVCPSNLNVTASDVVFSQGSSTVSFLPSALITENGSIKATVKIPDNIPTGYYNVTIGGNLGCPITSLYAFYVDGIITPIPTIEVYPYAASKGELVDIIIFGNGVSFDQGSATSCPTSLNVTVSDIVFAQGSNTISIVPISATTQDGNIYATLDLSADIPTGYYNLIVGASEPCPIYKTIAFFVDEKRIDGLSNAGPIILSNKETIEEANKPVVYPNPSDGSLLELQLNGSETVSVIVYNPIGIQLLNTTLNAPGKVNLIQLLSEENLIPGVYLINVIDGKNTHSQKFIIR